MNAGNPKSPGNSRRYHTGKPCCELGCSEPAGTAWSPHWCWKCNAERLGRIRGNLEQMCADLEAKGGGDEG